MYDLYLFYKVKTKNENPYELYVSIYIDTISNTFKENFLLYY